MNYIARLELDLMKRGIPFVHLTATHRQAIEAERRFHKLVDRPLTSYERYRYKFLDARIQGTAVEHVPVLILEDRANMNAQALAEALHIPAPYVGEVEPMIIEVNP